MRRSVERMLTLRRRTVTHAWLERDEIRLGRDDRPFFFSCLDATQHECCEPEAVLLCMGVFSRFCVRALRCTAEESLRCIRDTRSVVLRAYGESIQLQPIML